VVARNSRNESVVYWVIGVTKSCKVIAKAVCCSVIGSFNPCPTEVVDKPLVTFVAVWVVVISNGYVDNYIIVI
jgi:hypothetical protein